MEPPFSLPIATRKTEEAWVIMIVAEVSKVIQVVFLGWAPFTIIIG